MTNNTDDQSINQAKASRGGGRKAKSTVSPKNIDTGAGVNQLQQKLDVARESVATATETYVLGGIAIGLERIASGNFGEGSNAIFDVLDDFSNSVLDLEANNKYQLIGGSDEPKKMLGASSDSDIADAVIVG